MLTAGDPPIPSIRTLDLATVSPKVNEYRNAPPSVPARGCGRPVAGLTTSPMVVDECPLSEADTLADGPKRRLLVVEDCPLHSMVTADGSVSLGGVISDEEGGLEAKLHVNSNHRSGEDLLVPAMGISPSLAGAQPNSWPLDSVSLPQSPCPSDEEEFYSIVSTSYPSSPGFPSGRHATARRSNVLAEESVQLWATLDAQPAALEDGKGEGASPGPCDAGRFSPLSLELQCSGAIPGRFQRPRAAAGVNQLDSIVLGEGEFEQPTPWQDERSTRASELALSTQRIAGELPGEREIMTTWKNPSVDQVNRLQSLVRGSNGDGDVGTQGSVSEKAVPAQRKASSETPVHPHSDSYRLDSLYQAAGERHVLPKLPNPMVAGHVAMSMIEDLEAFDADTEDNYDSLPPLCANSGRGNTAQERVSSRRKKRIRKRKVKPEPVSVIFGPRKSADNTFPDKEMKDPLDDENVSEPEGDDISKYASAPVPSSQPSGYSWDAWAKLDSRLSGHDLRLHRMTVGHSSRLNPGLAGQGFRGGEREHYKGAAVEACAGVVPARFPSARPAGVDHNLLVSSLAGDICGDIYAGTGRASSPAAVLDQNGEVAIPASLMGYEVFQSDVNAASNRVLIKKVNELCASVGEVKENIKALMPVLNGTQSHPHPQGHDADQGSSDPGPDSDEELFRRNEPQPRGDDATDFARAIREGLAKIQDRKSQDVPSQSADIADIERWGISKRYGPTTEDGLPLALRSTDGLSTERKAYIASWNEEAWKAFFVWLKKEYPTYAGKEKEGRKRFMTHLKTLKTKYRRHLKAPVDLDQTKAQNSARQRRINRHARRLRVCHHYKDKYPEMREFYRIFLHFLDWRGCSGDETDGEICPVTNKKRHIITKFPWRASEVREWVELIDAIGRTNRFSDGDRCTAGNFPEPRYDALDFDKARIVNERFNNAPVKGLPENFYDSEWLKKRQGHELEELQCAPALSLDMCNDLLRKAQRGLKVTDRKTLPQVLEDLSESSPESDLE